jgi:septum formation inhibitor MinC
MKEKLTDEIQKAVAKGVPKSTQKKLLHKQYRNAVFAYNKEQPDKTNVENLKQMVSFDSIKSENHILFTQTIDKIGLSPFDDKRYVLEDLAKTLAHGHKSIPIEKRKKITAKEQEEEKERKLKKKKEESKKEDDDDEEDDDEEEDDDKEAETIACVTCGNQKEDEIVNDQETETWRCCSNVETKKFVH